MRRLAALAACVMLAAAPAPERAPHWVASWGSAQMVPDGGNALPAAQLTDATLRQVVRLSIGGDTLRVRLSNEMGTQPLVIDGATLAHAVAPGSAAIDTASLRRLTFTGADHVAIPAGAAVYSDPVSLAVAGGADVALSFHLAAAPVPQTGHPGARATSFVAAGAHAADADLPGAARVEHWYQIAGVEVVAPAAAATMVAIGDSITDGHGVQPDTNQRWTDRLAERLRAAPGGMRWGVVNAGIGGNRVLLDGLGPNLLARFDRDVIARPHVRTAIVLEGINDLGVLTRTAPVDAAAHAAIVAAITDAYRQIVARAHAHGIAVIGGTIMPFVGNDYYHPGAEIEADRQAINRFIRTSATFDAVIDFDRVMRDPARPDRLAPGYDLGDHLHPSPAGYRAMGDAVPLALLSVRPKPSIPAPAPTIALTFDDLPAHGPLPPGGSRLAVVRAIIAALRAEHAPAFGFVNGGFGADDPQSPAVLAAWRAAGLPLGNHGFSHMNLNTNPAPAFEADVLRDEPVIAPLMRGADWHWLRYPFLSEGETPAKRDGIRAFLKARGYRIAPVTMSFGDYGWNPPYARCMAAGNRAAVAALEASYLAAARDEAARSRAMAQALFGHDIPYVLLMHAGAFDARMLPRLLAQYRAAGYRFVTLAQATRDPFYAGALDLSRPGPSPSLTGAAATAGIAVPPGAALPDAAVCG